MPPPTGVVNGPLMATRNSRTAATVSSGSQVSNFALAFSPAKTSYQATRRLPLYAFSTAASNTRRDAFQISRPVPSPSINGITGVSGTCNSPPLYPIPFPSAGTFTPLYDVFMNPFPPDTNATNDTNHCTTTTQLKNISQRARTPESQSCIFSPWPANPGCVFPASLCAPNTATIGCASTNVGRLPHDHLYSSPAACVWRKGVGPKQRRIKSQIPLNSK